MKDERFYFFELTKKNICQFLFPVLGVCWKFFKAALMAGWWSSFNKLRLNCVLGNTILILFQLNLV